MSEYLGLYKGLVVDNNDPERRGRVVLHVPQVLGDAVTSWCEPNLPTISKPAVNDPVYVQFLNGDVAKPVYYSSEVLRVENIAAQTISVEMLDFVPSGVTTFHTEAGDTTVPLATAPGDLWVDGNNGNVTKRWDGSTWVEFQISGEAVAPGGIVGTHITDGEVSTPKLAAYAVTADKLEATLVLGSTISTRTLSDTGLTGMGIDLNSAGLVNWDQNGNRRVELPSDSQFPSVFRGVAEVDNLTANGSATLQDVSLFQGHAMTLQNSVAPPTNPPALAISYTQSNFTDDGLWGDRVGLAFDGTNYYTMLPISATSFAVEKWSGSTGAKTVSVTTTSATENYIPQGVVWLGGSLYSLHQQKSGWIVRRHSGTTLVANFSWDLSAADTGRTRQPLVDNRLVGFGVDTASGEFLLAQSADVAHTFNSVLVPAGFPRVQRVALATSGTLVTWGTQTVSDTAYAGFLGFCLYGTFDMASNVYIFGTYASSSQVGVMTGTGNWTAANRWSTAGAGRRGMVWTGSTPTDPNGRFQSVDPGGVRTTYETGSNKWTTATDGTWWVAYSWRNATTPAETVLSTPVVSVVMTKRARLTVNLPPLPGGVTEGRIYLAKGTTAPDASTASMTLQGSTVGGRQPSRIITAASFATPDNPTVSTFGSGTPASLRSAVTDSNGPLVLLNGDGSGRTGSYSWDSTGKDLSDTGWVTGWATAPSSQTTATVFTSAPQTAKYRRVGARMEIRFSCTTDAAYDVSTNASGDWPNANVFSGIPAGFRPADQILVQIRLRDMNLQGAVSTGGTVVITGGPPGLPVFAAGTICDGTISYFIG